MGDVNVKVGCDETGGIVNKWGVPRVNENRCYLVDVFVEMGLFLSIAFFFFSTEDDPLGNDEREEQRL